MGSILVLTTIASTLGGLVFGYELGIISGALSQLQTRFSLGCVQQESLVSALLIGSLSACLIGGWMIDRHGRRTSILLGNLLILGGSVILTTSTTLFALVIGRAVIGFAMSISSMSCCIFVSELVNPERRGLMVSLYEVGITFGILLAYGVNFILANVSGGWRYMFGFAIILCLMQLGSIWFLPQQDFVNSHLEIIEESNVKYSILDLFRTKNNMHRRTTIGIGLVLSQQFTGQPNVLFYASTILFSVGFQSRASAVLASVGLGIVKVVATLLAMVCSDRVGRRSLLIGGCTVLAVGLMVTGFFCGESVIDASKSCRSVEPHSNLSSLAEDQNSVNKMTWLVLSEIFPKDVRGRAYSFINCFNVGANLIVTFSFLSIIDVVGLAGIFLVYGVVGLFAAVFIYHMLPETKGKSLERIDRELAQTRGDIPLQVTTEFTRPPDPKEAFSQRIAV
ncbi:hypothetical protein DNTS_008257 [Danionella cerebrum]|nr:hypothetical protein DNTS_008257 [Danionella translucida]